MKKKLTILLLFVNVLLQAQQSYMYTPQGKINLNYSFNKILIIHKNKALKQLKPTHLNIAKSFTDTSFYFDDNEAPFTIIKIKKNVFKDKSNLENQIDALNTDTSNYVAYPFMETAKGMEIGLTNRINIMLKEGTTLEMYNKLFSKIGVKKIKPLKFSEQLYQLTLDSKNPLDVVNSLYEKSIFEFVEPDALIIGKKDIGVINDPFYGQQWSLGRMQVNRAWELSTGTGIVVAVIDDGVDITHPDLVNNLYNNGFDATGNRNDGSPRSSDGHGTCCAGIVCAVANNIGTRGIAYSSKLLPIRVDYGNWIADMYTTPSWIATAFNYCRVHNVDVVSCSWTVWEGAFFSIESSIDNLANNGRSGKGCLIFASSGNDNSSTVGYPARLSNVISVGNSDGSDHKAGDSNYGAGLSLVAPGVEIATTDMVGSNGFSDLDYNTNFNGTSASSPAAAGVMALILSINPNLTRDFAKHIIQSTCDKVGNYTYTPASDGTKSSETGYGRVNAWNAVIAAYTTIAHITGPTNLCYNNNGTYSVNSLSAGIIGISWAKSSNLSVVSGQTLNSFIVKNIGNNESGWVQPTLITANGSFTLPQYSIWLGAPAFSSISGPSTTPNYKEATFYVTPDPNAAINSYTWNLNPLNGNSLFPSGSYLDIAFYNTGNYQILVTGKNACGTGPTFWRGVMVTNSTNLAISPNPASTNVVVTLVNDEAITPSDSTSTLTKIAIPDNQIKYNVRVCNSFGIQLLAIQKTGPTFYIPIGDLPDGVYIIMVSDGKNEYSKQLVIKH